MTLVHRSLRALPAVTVLAVAALAVAPAIGAEVGVNIVDKEFEPPTITVAQGDTVTWTVTKAIPELHSVTSGEPGGSGQGGSSFDSGVVLRNNGDTFQHTFETPGEYDYFCQVHASEMRGKVVVLAPGQSPPAVEPPPTEVATGVPAERRALAAGILAIGIVLMFGLAWVWRRLNPA